MKKIFIGLLSCMVLVGCSSAETVEVTETAVPEETVGSEEAAETSAPAVETTVQIDAAGDEDYYIFNTDAALDWQNAYYELLKDDINLRTPAEESYMDFLGETYGMYFLYDIDDDGTSELFVRIGYSEAEYMMEVYTYENGETKLLDMFGAGHSSFYALEDGGLMQYWAHMGAVSVSEWTRNGDSLETQLLLEEENADEYKTAQEIRPGASSLGFVNSDISIALWEYTDDITTLSSVPNDQVEMILQDTVEQKGDVIVGRTGYEQYSDDFIGGRLDWETYINLVSDGSVVEDSGVFADVNGDGQSEYILSYEQYESVSGAIILSYQNDRVYAYYAGGMYSDSYITVDDEGYLCGTDCEGFVYHYRWVLYKDQAYGWFTEL